MPAPYEYSAVLHIHSRYSDGSGTIDEIVEAGRRSQVDVLWITDHDTLKGRQNPGEGWYGPVLLLVGTEITPPQNHLLAFGTASVPDAHDLWSHIVEQVTHEGGAGIVAHPEDAGNPTLRLPSYRWTEREVRGFQGLEIWNHLSQWVHPIHGVASGLWAYLHPWRGVETPEPSVLALWDQLGQEAPVVGIAGVDAHAIQRGFQTLGLTIFPYDVAFRTLRTHFLLHTPLTGYDAATDAATLVQALKSGHVMAVAWRGGTERGFRFWGEGPTGEIPMGSEVPWHPDLQLFAQSPVPVFFRVMLDGRLVDEASGRSWKSLVTRPGVWRVEASRLRRSHRPVPWIYTNPIYVRH